MVQSIDPIHSSYTLLTVYEVASFKKTAQGQIEDVVREEDPVEVRFNDLGGIFKYDRKLFVFSMGNGVDITSIRADTSILRTLNPKECYSIVSVRKNL